MARRLKLVTSFVELKAGMVVVDIACVCGHVHDSSLVRPAMTTPDDVATEVSWECDPVCVSKPADMVYGIDRSMVAAHRIFRWVELRRRSAGLLAEVKASR